MSRIARTHTDRSSRMVLVYEPHELEFYDASDGNKTIKVFDSGGRVHTSGQVLVSVHQQAVVALHESQEGVGRIRRLRVQYLQ